MNSTPESLYLLWAVVILVAAKRLDADSPRNGLYSESSTYYETEDTVRKKTPAEYEEELLTAQLENERLKESEAKLEAEQEQTNFMMTCLAWKILYVSVNATVVELKEKVSEMQKQLYVCRHDHKDADVVMRIAHKVLQKANKRLIDEFFEELLELDYVMKYSQVQIIDTNQSNSCV